MAFGLSASFRDMDDSSENLIRALRLTPCMIGTSAGGEIVTIPAGALGETEESFRLLVESVADYAIYMLDPAGTVVSWNTGAERLKGYTADEILGRDVSVFFPREDVADGKPAAELARAAAEGRTEAESWRVRKDGSRFWANVIVTALRYEDGRLRGFAKVTRDFSARKAADDKIHAYSIKLERSNRELESFAAVASHDLQEPLRKIRAFGDRLATKHGEAMGPDGRDYLERMRGAAARMQDLIENLLTYSRVTTKAQPFVQVDLGQVIREVLSDLESRVEQTRGRIDIGDLPLLEADAMQMRQLFQNLLGNALKFHRPDVPPVVSVTSYTLPRGRGDVDHCEICVRDNGIGFEQEYAERIFGLFQRLHGRSEFDGTGIGLAICRKIIERHGGVIQASGTPGEGAKFTFTLPLRQPVEVQLP
jgi:PAS domain S-box-containing protein